MASSRKASNGRSPLVNQQSQITSFFTKKSSSSLSSLSPTPPPSLSKPNPTSSPSSSPIPSTPSPLNPKRQKTSLVIGPCSISSPSTPDASLNAYGSNVVGKRIRVYWPLDRNWYEGCVKSFDKVLSKHLVQYDDAEEEILNLTQEKIEWPVEEPSKKFRRLRRFSVVEDGEVDADNEVVGEDDSSDEEWGKNVDKDETDGSDDLDSEVEENAEMDAPVNVKNKKRKIDECQNINSDNSKKSKSTAKTTSATAKVSFGPSSTKQRKSTPVLLSDQKPSECSKNKLDCGKSFDAERILECDVTERFGVRERTKLYFLTEDRRRDTKRRRPGDTDYDSSTLYLPPNFLKGLTGGQRQWWEFKSMHMDKVLFFKMGKFYELFEMDAHVGAKELDLQYMKGEQPHCGFPEKNFSVNVQKLAKKGYRVLVVEQTERPEQLELRRREQGCKDKVVRREICAVVTKGTLTEGEFSLSSPDASYLMAITESCQNYSNQEEQHIFGICMVDVATSKIILGQFSDDSDCSTLCCILSEYRPVEIVKPSKMLSMETERVLVRHTRNPLINELAPLIEFWDGEKTLSYVNCIYKQINSQTHSPSQADDISCGINTSNEDNADECLPDVLAQLVAAGENDHAALSALGGVLFYLKKAFLDESLLRFAKFELLPCTGLSDRKPKPYMVLDACALENLEIFENNRNGDSSGTLYAQLNHCITASGKRLLKRWLARPLCHSESIRARQDAIALLKLGANLPFALEFRKELSKLPDMERLLARVFVGSESNGRNANKVILYEDPSKKQLQEFISALRGCDLMVHACSVLGSNLGSLESSQLLQLLTPGKGLPDAQSVVKHFKNAFDWEEANQSGRIIPREGVDAGYDSTCRTVEEVECNLTKYLKGQRKFLGDSSINYVTIGKDAYLLEVPESLSTVIPREYELQSSKKGYFRYWTPVLKQLIKDLSQAEAEKESTLKSILQKLVERFSEHHVMWRHLVATVAELDVLISLSIASDYYEGPTCRPTIEDISQADEMPYLAADSLGHPILKSDALGKGTFVSNDMTLGGSGNPGFILLTGPNMGGKSTLLRQVCLAVILAQVGADVPAKSFFMSPVDRIFVRMGARDHIMAGQSTFLTELLETSTMLFSATRHSLVALDELGRGTSTSDGQAIAESVLDHFLNKVHCRGMFSTHYHRLAIDYEQDNKLSLCHMACQVGKGTTGLEDVTFLYKLTPGACPKSYGVNVALLAGLPEAVLEKAAMKSQQFEETYGKHRRLSKGILVIDNNYEEVNNVVKNVTSLLSSEDSGPSKVMMSSLGDLQHRARTLLGLTKS